MMRSSSSHVMHVCTCSSQSGALFLHSYVNAHTEAWILMHQASLDQGKRWVCSQTIDASRDKGALVGGDLGAQQAAEKEEEKTTLAKSGRVRSRLLRHYLVPALRAIITQWMNECSLDGGDLGAQQAAEARFSPRSESNHYSMDE
eukprot:1146731-Pelagomonas_calceolata.AAC.5